jgi:hypothetical protein
LPLYIRFLSKVSYLLRTWKVRSQECGTDRVCRALSEHLTFLRACVHSFVLLNSGSSKGLNNPSFGASIAIDRLACRLEMSKIKPSKVRWVDTKKQSNLWTDIR